MPIPHWWVPGRRTGIARLLAASLLILPLAAMARLDVAPTRLHIDDGERAASLMVVNRAEEAKTFRVVVADTEQFEEGGHELLSEPGEGAHHAASMMRYSPRQATLEPGERQVVRFQARRPSDLEEGEYRARVAVQTLPSVQQPTDPGEEEGVRIDIEVLFAVTLPLAITHGDPRVETAIGEVRKDEEGLVVDIQREGERSAYGQLAIHAVEDGEPGERIALRNRAVVVVPLDRRIFRFPDVDVESGEQVHVVYEGLEDRGGGTKAARTVTVR